MTQPIRDELLLHDPDKPLCADPCPQAPDLLPCLLDHDHGGDWHENRSSRWPTKDGHEAALRELADELGHEEVVLLRAVTCLREGLRDYGTTLTADQCRSLLDELALRSSAIPDADHVLVRFARHLLVEMEGEWSAPVQLTPEKQEDGTYLLIVRPVPKEEASA